MSGLYTYFYFKEKEVYVVERGKGIILILFGSMLWGLSGPMMEWVLHNSELSVSFFLSIRLVLAGIGLLAFSKLKGMNLLSIWREVGWGKQLILFSLLGMLGVQFTFIAAIDASNASIATLLQFLGPIYIILFVSWKSRLFPPKYQVVGILGTLAGLFLLLTNANIAQLLISKEALFWGVALGITFAFYTVYPARLMKEWGVLLVVGWGMLLGGITLAFVSRIWSTDEWGQLVLYPLNLVIFGIIIIGTVAFVMFLSSMKYISAVETSILSSVEPLTAMVVSVFWFDQMLGTWQYVGVLVMLMFVTWLSIGGEVRWSKK